MSTAPGAADATRNELNHAAGNVLQGRDFSGDIHLHAPAPASWVPRQLPADTIGFTGREDDLRRLDELLAGDDPTMLAIITGTAGVGKTALAVHWAHSVRSQFPDGDLYVNLRGYDDQPAMTANEALDGLLYALGAPPASMPNLADGRAGHLRTLLQGRKILIVLDNANSAVQVRPLLPGTAGCAVLVTSRSRLSGLGIRDGAHRMTLEPMRSDCAVALLRHIAGPRRVPEDSADARVIAERCAGLPLALRIAADRLAEEPAMTVRDLATELDNETRRLELFELPDDEQTSIRAVFSWSYRNLPAATAAVFRRLGLHPGPEFATEAAVASADVDRAEVVRALRALTGVHLLKQLSPHRWRMHDLLYQYARERAEQEERAAQPGVLRWYLAWAITACETIDPQRLHGVAFAEESRDGVAAFGSVGEANGWFRTEHANLLAAVHRAAAVGDHATAWQLTVVMATPLYARRAVQEWWTIGEVGLASARRVDDAYGEARVLVGLGGAGRILHRFDEALASFAEAEALFRALGDRAGEAMAIHNSGTVYAEMERDALAVDCFQRALALMEMRGPTGREQHTLHHLGTVYRRLGEFDAAVTSFREALRICNTALRCEVLTDLGETYRLVGRYPEAIEAYDEALAVALVTDDVWSQGAALRGRGLVLRDRGERAAADDLLRRALAAFERIGSADADELRDALRAS